MKKKTKTLILSIVITLVLLLTFTVTYAVFTYGQTGENNQQLVLGDIYMHYQETDTTINVDNMMPVKKESYEVEITDEKVGLCEEYIYDTYGITLGDYVRPMSNMVDSGKVKFMATDDEYTITHEYLCKNNLLQEINNGLFTQKDINYFIEIGLIKNVIDNIKSLDYFEFKISGKNTNTKGNILYNINLKDGDVVTNEDGTSKTKINDKYLRFRLTEVVNLEETILVDDKRFEVIDEALLYSNIIEKNTMSEINKTYRLYMWISEDVVIGNVDADYTSDEWKNLYASVKVNVNGKYVEPELLSEKVKSKLGSEGVVAVNTDGDLYDGIGEIREYRYSGIGNYCTYTDGVNDYRLSVETDVCPQTACQVQNFIINGNSEGFALMGRTCSQMGGTEIGIKDNQTTATDSGLRNYVYFNEELWRIIGVFGDNVKLIKDTPLANDVYKETTYTSGETTYNIKSTTEGTKYGYYIYKQLSDNSYNNDWTTSGVMHYLNDPTGTNYYTNGLSEESKNLIIDGTYNLGNVGANMETVADVYNDEINVDNIYDDNQANWTGQVGLLHMSDYWYSTRPSVWNVSYGSDYTGLRETWLGNTKAFAFWFLSPLSGSPSYVGSWGCSGIADGGYAYVSSGLRPVVNLKSQVMTTSGDGSYSNPYQISLG